MYWPWVTWSAQAGLDFLRRRLPQLKRGVRRTFYRGQRGKRRGDRAVSQPGGGFWTAGPMWSRWAITPWSKLQIADYLTRPLCAPSANFSQKVPGRG